MCKKTASFINAAKLCGSQRKYLTILKDGLLVFAVVENGAKGLKV